MTFHLEVSDDYLDEIEVPDELAALRTARDRAKRHGGDGVTVFPGPIRSGVVPIAHFDRCGRRTF